MDRRIYREPTAGLVHDGTRNFIVQPMKTMKKKMTTHTRVLTSNSPDRTNQFYIDICNKTDFNIFIDERTYHPQ